MIDDAVLNQENLIESIQKSESSALLVFLAGKTKKLSVLSEIFNRLFDIETDYNGTQPEDKSRIL